MSDREGERRVILFIAAGCMAIILAVIAAMAWALRLPDWAESVFSAIIGGVVVKLADALSALVALSSGRSVDRMGDRLAASTPPGPIDAKIVNTADQAVPVEPA